MLERSSGCFREGLIDVEWPATNGPDVSSLWNSGVGSISRHADDLPAFWPGNTKSSGGKGDFAGPSSKLYS